MIALNEIKSKAVRWVSKAAGVKHSLPILSCLNVNGTVAACDGQRFHMIPNAVNEDESPPVPALPDGAYHLDNVPAVKPKTIGIVNMRDDDDLYKDQLTKEYPDLVTLIPRREPALTVCVNPKYLADALSGMSGMVKLSFYDQTSPVLVQGTIEGKHDRLPALAVIMPMHDNGKLWWLPK